MNLNRTHELILDIYDTALNPQSLPQCLDKIADAAGVHGSIIFDWDRDENFDDPKLIAFGHSSLYPRNWMHRYIERHGKHEMQDQERLRELTGHHDRIELIDDTIFAGTPEQLRQFQHVRILERIGLFHRAAGVLNKDNRWISLITFQLKKDRPPLTANEREIIEPLLPHLAKSLSLMKPSHQLAQRNHAFLAALDRLKIGVCVMDRGARVIVENEEFRRQRDDFRVFYWDNHGALRFDRQNDQAKFLQLRENALNHGRYGARPRKEAISSSDESFLCVELVPFERCDEMGSSPVGGFILFSVDTSLPFECNSIAIQRAFGLTKAELELADAIAQGLTNTQIAEQRNRSIQTINSQVKSILAKTDCATRTQFARLMMSFGIDFLLPDDPPFDR